MNLTLKNQCLIQADALPSGKSSPEMSYIKYYVFVYFYHPLLAWEIRMLCIQNWVRKQGDMARYLLFLKSKSTHK